MKKQFFLSAILLFLLIQGHSQNGVSISDNGAEPHNSAMLDVRSGNKGVLVPRMTHAERNEIISPAKGLLVYQNDGTEGFYYFDGVSWTKLSSGVYNETDPVFGSSAAYGVSSTNVSNWNMAYGWGDHSGLYRPIAYVPAWNDITSNPFSFSSVANNQLLKYNSTTGKWENWTPDYSISTHTHQDANASQSGFLSISDKNKLDGMVSSQWTSNGTDIYHASGNVGIGVPAPHALLHLSNTIINRKIILYENNNNNHQFYGFGINDYTLRYQLPAISASHVFFAGASDTTSTELFRIRGNGTVAIPALNTAGVMLNNASGTISSSIGSSGQMLISNGSGGISWSTPASGTVTGVSGTAPIISTGGNSPVISITPANSSAAGSMSSVDKSKLDAISGTNTGDQLITLTGDVSGSGTGSMPVTISNDAVTNAKMSNMPAYSLKGNPSASDNNPLDINVGQNRFLARKSTGGINEYKITDFAFTVLDKNNAAEARTILGITSGTNIGDMLYWNGSGWIKIPVGTEGQLLKMVSNIPTWTSSITIPRVITDSATSITDHSAISGGNASDGGSPITEKGVCWSTSANPTVSNNKTTNGSGPGSFTSSLTELSEVTTYYIRAYATNSAGTGYGDELSFVTSEWQCGVSTITVNHSTSGGVAPVDKTVTYSTVTNIPGDPTKCWITSNLGADHQAAASNDNTEASAGWYWQFNRKQGYKHDGTTRIPETGWAIMISQNSNWTSDNDPCTLELGSGWRVPTSEEWENVSGSSGGNWTSLSDAWNSDLKIHGAGELFNDGSLNYRGLYGIYWSSTQIDNSSAWIILAGSGCDVVAQSKTFGIPLRCIKD